VSGGIEIPGLASFLSDPSDGTATVVQGLDSFPADERPNTREVNTVHLAWDVMVGIGTLLSLLSAWYALAWIFRRDMPRSKLFLRAASVAGVASVLAMEAGWVVTEVGRQPWIVRGHMKVEDAATTNEGVWITFIVVVAIYLALATTVVLVLRSMSRRFRQQAELVDSDVPYGPREPGPGSRPTEEPEPVGG
jgi:cytochrome d ubiquinol oxidase subunit I